MRSFETILAFAALFAVGWPVVFGSRPRRGIVAATISVALLAQIQIEGFRWQMIPLYLVAVGLAAGDVFFLERRLEWSSRLVRGILGTVGLVLAAFLPVALPVPEIPAPSGPAGIGTMTVDLIDRSRDEPYGERPGGPRELTAQVWYPATPDQGGERAVWSLDWEVVAPAISRNIGKYSSGGTCMVAAHGTGSAIMAAMVSGPSCRMARSIICMALTLTSLVERWCSVLAVATHS